MPLSDEIKIANNQIINMQFPRIIAFADVVNRYTQKILKNKVSWLRSSAMIFLITRGGTLTPRPPNRTGGKGNAVGKAGPGRAGHPRLAGRIFQTLLTSGPSPNSGNHDGIDEVLDVDVNQ